MQQLQQLAVFVRTLLHMCPHTTMYTSAYYSVCSSISSHRLHSTTFRPHTAATIYTSACYSISSSSSYVSSYYNFSIYVRILLYAQQQQQQQKGHGVRGAVPDNKQRRGGGGVTL